jgi:polysaccharide export outer membrane protein
VSFPHRWNSTCASIARAAPLCICSAGDPGSVRMYIEPSRMYSRTLSSAVRANADLPGENRYLPCLNNARSCTAQIRVVRMASDSLEFCRAMLRNWNFLSYPSALLMIAVTVLFQVGSAQNTPAAQDATHKQDGTKESPAPVSRRASDPSGQKDPQQTDSSALVLGPGDEVEIAVYGAPDLSEHTRVSAEGNISMPLIGYVRVAGLTSSEAEGAIEAQLRQGNIVNDPQVSLYVKEYTSGNISVAGEVAKPGAYSALGPHRLFDVLQAAGGLTEKAANRAVISHRGSEKPMTVELPKDPSQMALNNVEILPGDTVVVPAAPIVYMLGEVSKPGGYVLNSINGVTLLRVFAAAGGPTHAASVGGTKMVRRTPSGLQELKVPLKNILRAKAPDIPVQADDIIYVPSSRIKEVLNAGALATTLSTVAIYRIP